MRLSKNSKMLMSFFTKNKYINHIEQTKRTNNIITHLYDDILNAHNYLLDIKEKRGANFYNITTKKIHTSAQITRPQNFNSNSFPQEIRNHIDELAVTELCYQFSLFNRKIKLSDVNLSLQSFQVKYKEILLQNCCQFATSA